jgi:hypothetical protein
MSLTVTLNKIDIVKSITITIIIEGEEEILDLRNDIDIIRSCIGHNDIPVSYNGAIDNLLSAIREKISGNINKI